MTSIRRPERWKYTQEQAEQILRAAGYEPRVPFPGLANASWEATCTRCNQPRKVNVSKIAMGVMRCRHTRPQRGLRGLPLRELIDKYNDGAGLKRLAHEYRVADRTVRTALEGHVVFRQPGWQHGGST